MANHEQHHLPPSDPAASPAPQLSGKGASRRRMAGLGASGVLMTLASNNAMAALVCKSPSGALSGSLTSQAPTTETCQGRVPDYWKANPASWPGDVSPTEKFGRFFPSQPPLSNLTLLEILNRHAADRHKVAEHIVATYLNVITGRIGFLTAEMVVSMWSEYETTRQFVPAKGATPWNGSQLVYYLKSTME
ncbi:MAG: hypothetical protein V4723_10925 [Pseudomonadota bacterium]